MMAHFESTLHFLIKIFLRMIYTTLITYCRQMSMPNIKCMLFGWEFS